MSVWWDWNIFIVVLNLYKYDCTTLHLNFNIILLQYLVSIYEWQESFYRVVSHSCFQEAQLNEVLSASNLDPTALTVVTRKLEVSYLQSTIFNGLQVNGGEGCSTASLLKVWYFAILMMFWNILLDMCIFFYLLHYCPKIFSKIGMHDL